MSVLVLRADARNLPLPDRSVDAVVCDPPYGLEFMGKDWDSFKSASSRGPGGTFALGTVGGFTGKPMPRHGKRWRLKRCTSCGHVQGGASPCTCEQPDWEVEHEPGTPNFAATYQRWCEAWATEALRVLKPGGHLLAFGGTRTWHRLVCAIEDAGFEIRDCMMWLYGSGFPKSRDVSKDIDAAAGATREVIGARRYADGTVGHWTPAVTYAQDDWSTTRRGKADTAPATDAARRWQGFGTALKPGWEPIVVARRPLAGTVAANVLGYGTGALNIDGCRVGDDTSRGDRYNGKPPGGGDRANGWRMTQDGKWDVPVGRWPTNVVLSHAPLLDEHGQVIGDGCAEGCVPGCPVADLDRQSGTTVASSGGVAGWQDAYVGGRYKPIPRTGYDDQGGASRFFPTFRYQAKADDWERPRITLPPKPVLRLRSDLTEEQRTYVLAELTKAGVDVS